MKWLSRYYIINMHTASMNPFYHCPFEIFVASWEYRFSVCAFICLFVCLSCVLCVCSAFFFSYHFCVNPIEILKRLIRIYTLLNSNEQKKQSHGEIIAATDNNNTRNDDLLSNGDIVKLAFCFVVVRLSVVYVWYCDPCPNILF